MSTFLKLIPFVGAARRDAERNPERVHPPERNLPETEELRRSLQNLTTYGEEPRIAYLAGQSCCSVAHQLQGSNRLSADLVRAKLRVLPREEAERLALAWLFGEKR